MTQPALDLVIAALEKIREKSDRAPRASRTALARLQAGYPLAVFVRETSASPLGRRLQEARDKAELLGSVRERVRACKKCAHLACSRTQTVFGVGNPDADLMFIGEAPGADEDIQGEPFVGRGGKLLTNMIKAMGLGREEVYIANIIKCRPPNNRTPERDECETCSPFLMRQIATIKPKVIVALGAVAARTLLAINDSMSNLRGRWYEFQPTGVRSNDPNWTGAKLAVTYHPAFLLRDPRQKKEAWKDLQMVMKELGLKAPAK